MGKFFYKFDVAKMHFVFVCVCITLCIPSTEATIQIEKINTTAVVARWEPMPEYQFWGNRLGYLVKLYKSSPYWGIVETHKTTETNIMMSNLEDWVEYHLTVQGYTAHGQEYNYHYSFYYSSYFRTPTMRSPSGLNVNIANVSAVEARWSPIPQDQVRGVLLGYVVRLTDDYSSAPLQTLKTNTTSIVVTNLQAKKYYRLLVQGYTNNDTGLPAVHAYIYIYSIPSPSGLQVTTVNSTTVVARWDALIREKVQGVLLGYIVKLWDYGPYQLVQTHKTSKTSIVLNIVEWLRYRVCVQGYTANETGSDSCIYLDTYAIPSPSHLSYSIVNVTTVVVHWYPLPKDQGKNVLLGYIVRLRKRDTPYQFLQTQETNETRIVIKDLKVSTSYIIYVQGYTAEIKGRPSYQSIYIRPVLRSPTNVQIAIVNLTIAVVRWNPIPKDQITDGFLGYVVSLHNSIGHYQHHAFKTNKTNIVIEDLKDWMHYRVSVQGYSAKYTGPSSSYESFNTPTMRSPSGLNVNIANITTVEARWSPIPQDQVRGVLLGYVVRLTDYYSSALLQTLKTKKTSIVVTNLQANKNYQLYVQGYTAKDTGQSASQTIYINPVPKISGLKITIINTTKVVASWDPIPSEHVFGNLLGYHVRLYLDYYWRSRLFNINRTSIMLDYLFPGRAYYIYVWGYTANERGPWNYHRFIAPCIIILKDKLQGNIQVKPAYDHGSLSCSWQIQGLNSKSMIFLFLKSVHIARTSYNCRDDHLAVTDGQGQEITRLCRQTSSLSFISFGSAKITFVQRHWYNDKFIMSYFIVNDGIENVPLKKSWNISASSNSSTSINVKWNKFSGPDVANHFIAVCIAQNSRGGIFAGNTNSQAFDVAVTNLDKNTVFEVVVLAVVGSSLNISKWNNTITKSQSIVVKTLEDVPSQPPTNVRVIHTAPTSTAVSWNSLVDVNGEIVGYNLYYKMTRESVFNSMGTDSNTTKLYLKNLKQVTEYMIRVAALTKIGEGPKSRVIYFTTGCRKTLSEASGNFSSPNYPRNYLSNVNCTWAVARDRAFAKLFILFWTFDVEEIIGTKCSDFVKVLDKSGKELFKGCGRKERFAVITSRSADVIFHSDSGIEKRGFNATYFTVPSNSRVVTVNVNGTTTSEASLKWNSIVSSNEVSMFTIFYKVSEESNNWRFINTVKSHVTISGLRPSTKYEAIVTETRDTTMSKSDLKTFVTQNSPMTSPTEEKPTTSSQSMQTVYDYGLSEGDQVISSPWEYTSRCKEVSLGEDGFLFVMKRHHQVYICRNGVLRFDSPSYLRWPVLLKSGQFCELQILGPYWSLSYRSYSTVYYHLYQSTDNSFKSKKVLEQVSSDILRLHKGSRIASFKASWALVVTWDKLRHSIQNLETQNLRNTFQAVLITDGVASFAMYNYPENKTQWSAETSESNRNNFADAKGLPVVGWRAECNRFGYYTVQNSSTVYISDIDQEEGHSVSIETSGIKPKPHGYQGKWLFQLYMHWKISSAKENCKSWFKKQPDPRPFLEYLEPCPCTSRQAWFDERFTPEKSTSRWSWQSEQKPCAISTFPSVDGWEQKCCYSHEQPQWGAIVVGHPGGGYAYRFLENEKHWYTQCCVHSNLCHLFYQRLPSDDCRRYEPPEWSWMWGDPHFVTLDGKNYTFNGLGEYTMLDARNGFFKLQSRTRLAKGEGTATVFCAAVMKEVNSSTVQINLERNGNMILLVDGIDMNFYSLNNQTKRLNGSVVISRQNERVFKATYPSGISVTLTESKGALSVLVALPTSFKNQTKGLLGTWNGDKLDDFTTPIGYVIPANSTSRTIHFDFGQKWQVNENNTLFTYGANENVSTNSNASFVPMFIDELRFANKTLEVEAREKCGNDINCLFDAASTNDVSVGLETKVVGSQMINDSVMLKNSPPKFSNSTDARAAMLTVNTTKSLHITAKDPDDDAVRFDVTGLPKGGIITRNGFMVTVSWKVTMEKVDLQFIATDSKGASSVLKAFFKLCACQNSARCIDSSSNAAAQDYSRFSIMPCQCSSGYTGKFCEADIDACAINLNPCYPGVKCRDHPAPANETGYECGSCPNGFTGQGDSCQDIDECYGRNHGCSQICSNSPGSYVCSCANGFKLDNDGRTCKDTKDEETIPTQPPATKQDIENSVNVTIKHLNISAEWNLRMELSFKKGVAREVTSFCAKENTCRPSKQRERRSNDYTVFTSDHVHILPGYPVQNDAISEDNHNAIVAFYVRFPQNGTGSNPLDGEMLTNIINGSLARIGQDIGKLLLSVAMFQKRTESTTETPPTTSSPNEADDKDINIIIWSSVTTGVFFIVVVIIAVVVVRYCNKRSSSAKKTRQVNKKVNLLKIKQNGTTFSYINPTFGDKQK